MRFSIEIFEFIIMSLLSGPVCSKNTNVLFSNVSVLQNL